MDVAAVGLLDYNSYYIIVKAHYMRRIFDPQMSNEIQGKRGPQQKGGPVRDDPKPV